MSTEEEDDFEYGGHLVYNEVCQVKEGNSQRFSSTARSAEVNLLEILPDFEEGTQYNPGKGYERLLIRDYIMDSNIPSETKDFMNDLICIQYKYEEFEEAEAIVGEERRTVQIPSVNDSNILWNHGDYMLFRGSESDAKKAKSQTQTATGDDLRIHSITFESNFLLWMFYKAYQGNRLSNNLSVQNLQDAEVKGDPDDFGGEAAIRESDDIKQSPAILLGIINEKEFSKIEGDFTLDLDSAESSDEYTKATLRVEIQQEKLQVKASKAGLRNADQIDKLSLATHIVNEFAKLYDHWDSLDPHNSDKYVPPTFIVELIRVCRNQDIEYTDTPRHLLEILVDQRGESLGDYNLSL